MHKRSIVGAMGVGALLALVAQPVLAAEYRVWNFDSASECDIGGTSEWYKQNNDNADWTPSWDGNSSLHIDFLQPSSPGEQARMAYNFPIPNTMTFATYPSPKVKLTVSGVPSGQTIEVQMRLRLSCCGYSPRVTAFWELGNGEYILAIDMLHTQIKPPSGHELGVWYYNDDGTGHVYAPATDTMYQYQLYFDLTRMPYALWSVEYANMKVDIDWIALSDDCMFGGHDDCFAGEGEGEGESEWAELPRGGWFEVGGRLELHVALAHPVGEVTYQWRKNGLDLLEETASAYVVPSLTGGVEGDSGWYSVRVRDDSKVVRITPEVHVEVFSGLPLAGLVGLGVLAAVTAGFGMVRIARTKR